MTHELLHSPAFDVAHVNGSVLRDRDTVRNFKLAVVIAPPTESSDDAAIAANLDDGRPIRRREPFSRNGFAR